MKFNSSSLSSYLAFRYVVDRAATWSASGAKPNWPDEAEVEQTEVSTSVEIEEKLRAQVEQSLRDDSNTGILLSGGIDSAILAKMMPKGALAFTIRFLGDGVPDESEQASLYAEQSGVDLRIVDVGWEEYQQALTPLMSHKCGPLHAVEPALYVAAKRARSLGVTNLIVGNGADSTFGGMDLLLSRDWTVEEFANRYTFVDPETVLRDAVSPRQVFERYATDDLFDVQSFLKTLHGEGITQSFWNALSAAGCHMIEPYETLALSEPLDLERIRAGEPKYLLQDVFHRLYPSLDAPRKIPFRRPMDDWLSDWSGPTRPEFLPSLDLGQLNGDKKFLIYCLELFLNFLEEQSQ